MYRQYSYMLTPFSIGRVKMVSLASSLMPNPCIYCPTSSLFSCKETCRVNPPLNANNERRKHECLLSQISTKNSPCVNFIAMTRQPTSGDMRFSQCFTPTMFALQNSIADGKGVMAQTFKASSFLIPVCNVMSSKKFYDKIHHVLFPAAPHPSQMI